MSRTYIKMNINFKASIVEGGVYLDAISHLRPYSGSETRTVVEFGDGWATINKPIAEVEDMLMELNQKQPQPLQLDWRSISGNLPAPPKAPKQKKGRIFNR